MIKVTNARFLQSCERFSQAPSILGAEIAILGRSNVGKSSLINALLNHKNLAKSSATPGKTRLINFFSAKWRVDSADCMFLSQGGWLLRSARKSYGLPRSHSLTRNDEILDSSPTAQNDKNKDFAESSKTTPQDAESTLDSTIFPLDSALSTQKANYAITDEFLGFCEASDEDRTQVHRGSEPKQSLKSRCESEFEIRILDFPGFGYARVSKAEKSSWDRHLSEFLNKRDSIKLYLHLIDARHQNLELDNEIFAFLNRFKRGDSAILQVFTKADKLGKNELFRLKKQHKLYHTINDKNSTEILRWAILKLLYNVDSMGFANS